MKSVRAIALLGMLASSPVAATSVIASSEASYRIAILSNQVDAYNSTDGSSTFSGTGTYSVAPNSAGSFSGGGGSAAARWSATADAPPASSAQVDQAWFPNVDAQGKALPIYHVYNGTEFAVPI